jgi:hypothetical protein
MKKRRKLKKTKTMMAKKETKMVRPCMDKRTKLVLEKEELEVKIISTTKNKLKFKKLPWVIN